LQKFAEILSRMPGEMSIVRIHQQLQNVGAVEHFGKLRKEKLPSLVS